MTEDEMVGQHHQLNGHEFEQTQGDGEGQGILVCCSSWGHRVEDNLVTDDNNGNKNKNPQMAGSSCSSPNSYFFLFS